MRPCAKLEDYIDGTLEPDAALVFEQHLPACDECRLVVERNVELRNNLVAYLDRQDIEIDSYPKAAHVIALAVAKRSRARLAAAAVSGATAAVVAAICAITWKTEPTDSGEKADTPAEEITYPARTIFSRNADLRANGEGGPTEIEVASDGKLVLDLGLDRIGLDSRSSARIVRATPRETRLRLESGRAVFDVRTRNDGGTFIVESSGFEIRVVGTRFLVGVSDVSGLEVAVSEGTIEVHGSDGLRHRVVAGRSRTFVAANSAHSVIDEKTVEMIEALLSPRATEVDNDRNKPADELAGQSDAPQPEAAVANAKSSSPKAATVPDKANPKIPQMLSLDDLTDLVLDDRCPDAKPGLVKFLEQAPNSPRAWSLLADCERKLGRIEPAVQAYRQVIALGSPRMANRARYLAAVLLQSSTPQHRNAAELLEQYIRQPTSLKPLEADAKLRLARSNLALGNRERAVQLLMEIDQAHAGSPAAIKARKLLAELKQ